MNSVIEVMERDHLTMEGLFRNLENELEPMQRAVIFTELAAALEGHTRAEEAVIYPALMKSVATKRITYEAQRENANARELVTRIQSSDCAHPEWTENLGRLRRSVRRHVAEVEGMLFSRMRDFFTVTQLKEMAVDFTYMKENWATARAS